MLDSSAIPKITMSTETTLISNSVVRKLLQSWN